jgi:hypothetical protein
MYPLSRVAGSSDWGPNASSAFDLGCNAKNIGHIDPVFGSFLNNSNILQCLKKRSLWLNV